MAHGLPLVPDPLVKAISENRRIAYSETQPFDLQQCINAASDAMPGDYITEDRLRERITHKINMPSEHLSMALINVGGVSRAMKAGGKVIPRSRHPNQPTVLERFVLNNYAHVSYIIEAGSFRTDRIIKFARRYYRVIGFVKMFLVRRSWCKFVRTTLRLLSLCTTTAQKTHRVGCLASPCWSSCSQRRSQACS